MNSDYYKRTFKTDWTPSQPVGEGAYIEATADRALALLETAIEEVKLGGFIHMVVLLKPDDDWEFYKGIDGIYPVMALHYQKLPGSIKKSVETAKPYDHFAGDRTPGLLVAKFRRI